MRLSAETVLFLVSRAKKTGSVYIDLSDSYVNLNFKLTFSLVDNFNIEFKNMHNLGEMVKSCLLYTSDAADE